MITKEMIKIEAKTDDAVLVSLKCCMKTHWIAKSVIEIESGAITMPDWVWNGIQDEELK